MRHEAGSAGPRTLLIAAVRSSGRTADATAANIASRLPSWLRQHVVYADRAAAAAIEIGEKDLSLVRTFRNQAGMAFRAAT